MKLALYQIDAFTDKIFKGNPAVVCPLEKWLDDDTLLQIAAENNLSETAFFVQNNKEYNLRWFTPKTEVNLCGHATLASAYVIFDILKHSVSEITFQSKSGPLIVRKKDDLLAMDFPATPGKPVDLPEYLVSGLKLKPSEVYKSRDYMAIVDSEDTVRSLIPSFQDLEALDATGIIVTAPGDTTDFVSRFFAPQVGINEDPVTGSAHCTLVPYWSSRLQKQTLHARQVSQRSGELFCRHLGDRVEIAGRAVKYLEGFIEI